MSSLTKEESEELAKLEGDEKARLEAQAIAEKRQHLEALRLSKRLAPKHGVPGRDFVVLETTAGNIAVRRPLDVEVDMITEGSERAEIEKFSAAVTIEPATAEIQKLMAENPGVTGAVMRTAMGMLKVIRGEEQKK